MKYLNNLLAVIVFLLSCTACSEDGKNIKKPDDKTAVLSSNTDSGINITREYLLGEWCYAYVKAGYGDDKEREDQNITYIFKKDGSLLFQNNSNTSVEKEGSYELADGELTISPALRFLPAAIHSVDNDRFVLGNSVTQLTFLRGACKG